MVSEMFGFDCWLEGLERKIQGLSARLKLKTVASLVRFDFETILWFVCIQGKRWSHVAGDIPEQPGAGSISQITLNKNFGVVIESQGRLKEADLKALIDFINCRILTPETVFTDALSPAAAGSELL